MTVTTYPAMLHLVLTATSEDEAVFVAMLLARRRNDAQTHGTVTVVGREVVVVATVEEADRIERAMVSAGCTVSIIATAEA